jgi:hypothetical protein
MLAGSLDVCHSPSPRTHPCRSDTWAESSLGSSTPCPRRLVVPTQPRALAFPAGPAAARVRHLAPAPAPVCGLPPLAAFGEGDVRSARRRSLGGARPPGAPRHRETAAASAGGTGTSSPCRSGRSPRWRRPACPTARSASNCPFRTARSRHICTGSSRSSALPHAHSSLRSSHPVASYLASQHSRKMTSAPGSARLPPPVPGPPWLELTQLSWGQSRQPAWPSE